MVPRCPVTRPIGTRGLNRGWLARKNRDGRPRVRGSVRSEFAGKFGKSLASGNAVPERADIAKHEESDSFCPLHLRGVAPMISAEGSDVSDQ